MTAFTNAGRDLIAAKQAASQVLTLDRFVLANIVGLDHTAPVDPNEALPQAGDIVWQGAVTASGYVNPDQVVYSVLLGSNVGDFTFNWIGLQADDDTLVAVAYVPPQLKTATNGTATGNNLTRNFLLAFTDAQTTTNISVAADTWQIDFNARLDGIDERERLANLELYGRQRFLNDGWLLQENTGSYSLKAGDGFVAGYRVSQASDLALGNPGALPKDVWLDVALAGDITGKVISVTPVISNAAQSDYTDGSNINHYLEKVGTINANGTVTDLRSVITAAGALVDEFLSHAVQATETTAGKAEVATQTETDAGTDDSRMVTPKKLASRLANFVRNATTTVKGFVELATSTETQAGTDAERAVTPAGLASVTATETRAGLAEVATQAETDGGSDDTRMVTPKKLRWGLSWSIGATGYLRFPSWLGSFTFQWGAVAVSSAAWVQVTFPLAFPGAAYSVTGALNSGDSGLQIFEIKNVGLNSFEAYSNSSSSTLYWMAFGI